MSLYPSPYLNIFVNMVSSYGQFVVHDFPSDIHVCYCYSHHIYNIYWSSIHLFFCLCNIALDLKTTCMLTIRSSPIQDHELFNRWVKNRTIDRTHLDDVDVKFLLACITDQPVPMYITLQLEKIQSVCIWVIAGDNSNGISETNKMFARAYKKDAHQPVAL